MSVKKYLVLVGLIVVIGTVVGVGLAAADGDDVLSPAVEDDASWLGLDVDDSVLTYGGGAYPGWIVDVDEDTKKESLEVWVEESDSREIQSQSDTRYTVSAPVDDVVDPGIISDSGLYTFDYIERIDYNTQVELVEPVEEIGENEDLNAVERWVLDGGLDGQAHEANETTIEDARENVGANDVTETGEGVRVAVIDTGLNYDADLYGDRIVGEKNFITGETGTDAIADGNGHGDWVASAIAADGELTGIAPDAELAIARALDDDGSGSTDAIVDAVKWSCEEQDADIVSMSLGSPLYSEALADAVNDCVEDHDAVVVAAAGNMGQNPATMYISSPADTPEDGVIAVGATTNEPAEEARIGSFSEVGPNPGYQSIGETAGVQTDIAAPGMEITVQTANGDSTLTGTSMATPIVSGTIALGMEADANLRDDPTAVVERLDSSSASAPHIASNEAQYGFVDAEWLVTGDTRDQTQEEARNDKAVLRDAFYDSHSTSRIMRFVDLASDWL